RRERRCGSRLAARVEIAADCRKDFAEHVRGQDASVRVIARAVIAVEQYERVDRMLRAVAEWPGDQAAAKGRHGAVMGDTAQQHDRGEIWHFRDRRLEEIATLPDLLAERLVFRWNAPHRIGDPRIDKPRTIVRSRRIFAGREAVACER